MSDSFSVPTPEQLDLAAQDARVGEAPEEEIASILRMIAKEIDGELGLEKPRASFSFAVPPLSRGARALLSHRLKAFNWHMFYSAEVFADSRVLYVGRDSFFDDEAHDGPLRPDDV